MGIHHQVDASIQPRISVQKLREIIKKDHQLATSNISTDDETLLRFLRLSEFNIQEALQKFRDFYSKRTELFNWFSTKNSTNPDVKFEPGEFIPLPGHDFKERKVLLFRKAQSDPKDLDQFLKNQYMILDLMVMDPTTQIHGVVLLVDHDKFSSNLSLLPEVVTSESSSDIESLQEAYPMKTEAVYIFRAPKEYETIFNVRKTIMIEKLKKEFILVGSDCSKLLEYFPDSLLPDEYGGKAGNVQKIIDEWLSKIKSHKNKRSTGDSCWPWVEGRERTSSFTNRRDNSDPQTSLQEKLHEIVQPEKD